MDYKEYPIAPLGLGASKVLEDSRDSMKTIVITDKDFELVPAGKGTQWQCNIAIDLFNIRYYEIILDESLDVIGQDEASIAMINIVHNAETSIKPTFAPLAVMVDVSALSPITTIDIILLPTAKNSVSAGTQQDSGDLVLFDGRVVGTNILFDTTKVMYKTLPEEWLGTLPMAPELDVPPQT